MVLPDFWAPLALLHTHPGLSLPLSSVTVCGLYGACLCGGGVSSNPVSSYSVKHPSCFQPHTDLSYISTVECEGYLSLACMCILNDSVNSGPNQNFLLVPLGKNQYSRYTVLCSLSRLLSTKWKNLPKSYSLLYNNAMNENFK